jgi:Amino acid synthesis
MPVSRCQENFEEICEKTELNQLVTWGILTDAGAYQGAERLSSVDWAGGWAMRQLLGEPKAIVPAAKAVASAGYRLMVPLHYIHACYVRSHFNSMEVGIQDAPRPNEILFALVMGTGGRVHSRLGGLTKDKVQGHDGQR